MISSVPKLEAWLSQNKGESLKFHGVAIIVDIAGMSALAESISALGKTGAQTLSRMLSACFESIIPAIHAGGGEILQIAGAAILAVFPDTEKSANKRLANALEKAYATAPFAEEEFFQKPKIRISAASGQITLSHYPHSQNSIWIAGGSAIENAYKLDSAGESSEINYNTGPEADAAEKDASAAVATALFGRPVPGQTQAPALEENEFRNVLAVFARYNSSDTASFIKAILECQKKAGGDTAFFTETDKGIITGIFFGCPDNPPSLFLGAKEFMCQVQAALNGAVSFGAAYGACYCGSVGTQERSALACIGPAVDMAHRLIQEATVGSTLVPKNDAAHWLPLAGLIHSGTLHCKGLKAPLGSMRITRYFEEPAKVTTGVETGEARRFKARAKELASIQAVLGSGELAVIEIYGPRESGKSDLVHEAVARAGATAVTVLLDRVTKTSLSGFSSACAQLLGIVSLEAFGKPCYMEDMLDMAKNTGLASRHISALATIMALPGYDREFRSCPESGRINFLAEGFASLLSAARSLRPIALFFDDMHEYSPSDAALARALATMDHNPPIQIICASANNDLSLFPLEGGARQRLIITLEPLSEADTRELAATRLEKKATLDDLSNIPLLVYNADRSGRPDILEECLLAGIRWAASTFRNSEAIAWSEKLLANSQDNQVKAEASLLLAQTLAHTGNLEGSIAAYRIALELAEQIGIRDNLAAACCDLALLYIESGEIAKAKPLVDKLALMTGETSPLPASRIYDTVLTYYYYTKNLVEARRIAVLQCKAAAGEKEPIILAKSYASMVAVSLADQLDAEEPLLWLNKELSVLQNTQDLRMLAECYRSFSVTHHRRKEFKLALQYCNAHMDCAQAIGDSTGFLFALARRGNVKVLLKRFEEAIKDFRELELRAFKSGNLGLCAAAKERLGNALHSLGKPDEALPHYLDSYKMSRESGDRIACSVAASAIGRIYHEGGETKKALSFLEAELNRARESADTLGKGLAYGDIGIILGDEGKTEKALECIDYAIGICQKHSVPGQLARLYLEKAYRSLEKTAAAKKEPMAEDKITLKELCEMAREHAIGSGDPAVADIPWKSRIMEARIEGGDSLARLLASIQAADVVATDKALWFFEMSLLEPGSKKAAGLLASAKKLDTRLVNKYSRHYAKIASALATESAS